MTGYVGETAQALNRFLASQESRAYRMALLATGRREDALDIVQDAMLKLVRRYAANDPSEWPALFVRIVQNAIKDWYRRDAIRQRWRQWFGHRSDDEAEAEDPIAQVADTGSPAPEEKLNQHTAMTKLDQVLNRLPLRQQQVFLLREWEGLDVAQTARAMGISEGSVKTHYSRAVHKLREELEDYWR